MIDRPCSSRRRMTLSTSARSATASAGSSWVGPIHFDDLDLDRPPSTATREIETRIDGQAIDPGVEPIGLTKASQVAPGPEETLLDSIARELVVPEDQASGRVQPRDGRVNELGEGVVIALPRPLDELSLVHGHLCGRRHPGGRVYSLWRRRPSKCSRSDQRRFRGDQREASSIGVGGGPGSGSPPVRRPARNRAR